MAAGGYVPEGFTIHDSQQKLTSHLTVHRKTVGLERWTLTGRCSVQTNSSLVVALHFLLSQFAFILVVVDENAVVGPNRASVLSKSGTIPTELGIGRRESAGVVNRASLTGNIPIELAIR